ncbi:tRNA (adenosine(37)-N6)-threonylcarbamoyltransferase complex ATPase subunit type 1 TsaE, partial [Metamycoplasma hyosynoviae]|nr:tRNA (adenosine(37)-N6)-threonylcarbamoyltransferase complex ATPase subunit type 1 TsaE [Metamycoplasma hyosynoviae]
ANKHSIYKITLSDNLKKISMELIMNENNYEKLNYDLFEKNIFTYLNFSKKVDKDNLLKEELIYLSNPQIGELKW